MLSQSLHQPVLRALFILAKDGRAADLHLVARATGLSCVEADRVLERLESAGLVDAERVRLTFAGLAVAVALPPNRRRAPRRTSLGDARARRGLVA